MKNAAIRQSPDISQTTEKIIMHHLDSFCAGDLDAVMADYTEASVFITQDAIYRGTSAIRSFFIGLMAYFPKDQPGFELDKISVINELVLIVWHATTPGLHVSFGTDSFFVKDSKIYQQTFAGCMQFSDNGSSLKK